MLGTSESSKGGITTGLTMFFVIRLCHLILFISSVSSFTSLRVPLTKVRDPDADRNFKLMVESTKLNHKSGALPKVKLTKNYYQYFGDVKVGSNRQTIRVAFDTAFYNLLVPDAFSSSSCTSNHNAFDKYKSTTFISTGNLTTGNPPYRTLQPARDTVEIGGISVVNQTIGLIIDGDCRGLKFDGIFGLGFAVSQNEQTVISNLFKDKKIPQYVVGMNLNRDHKNSKGGEIIIGGINNNIVNKNTIQYIQANRYSSLWEITLNKVLYGTKEIAQNKYAIIDSSFSFIGVPKEAFSLIRNAVNGIFVNSTILVDKSLVKNLPALTFNIDGRDYTLSGTDYVNMAVEIQSLNPMLLISVDTNEWILGNSFLGKYYTILDYQNTKIAFATISGATSWKQFWLMSATAFLVSLAQYLR